MTEEREICDNLEVVKSAVAVCQDTLCGVQNLYFSQNKRPHNTKKGGWKKQQLPDGGQLGNDTTALLPAPR